MKKLKLDELGRVSAEDFKKTEKIPVCILLDSVRSLHNVGSAFRSADAFKIEKIYLTGITGKPPHREIEKTALGATDTVTWEYFDNPETIISQLKEDDYSIILVEQTTKSISLQEFNPDVDHKYCMVFGNEVNGISENILPLSDGAIEIPQAGTKHSLNISVCLGIVMWEMFKKLSL